MRHTQYTRRPLVVLLPVSLVLLLGLSALQLGLSNNASAANLPQYTVASACDQAQPGFANCFAKVVTVRQSGQVLTPHVIGAALPTATPTHTATATPTQTPTTPTPSPTKPPSPTPPATHTCVAFSMGYTPCDLQAAYNLPSWTAGSGQTIAIVDAYDDPNAEADLAKYRTTFNLPACTTVNGCFSKVNQAGGTQPPSANSGWATEIALDLDMASAICPQCHILLVEASSSAMSDLATAENLAAQRGATEISNSYGGSEFAGETQIESAYNHPGIAITVSSGDSGYGVEFPAASQYVTAVGGTNLKRTTGTGRGWTEAAWTGAGSGCSRFITQPAWQANVAAIKAVCQKRSVADVAAIADPNTPVLVYDSYQQGGWLLMGGTSASAPIVAGSYALAGNAKTITAGSYPYAHLPNLFNITSGSNGSCGTILCKAGAGWNGPTGNGTPNTATGL